MYTVYALSLDKARPGRILRHFSERGIKFGDVVDCELDEIPLSVYSEYMRSAGMTPEVLVSTLDIVNPESRESALSRVYGYIDSLHRLNIPMLMLAPTVRPSHSADELRITRDRLIDAYARVIDYSLGSGVDILIENQSSLTRPDSTVKDVRYILDALPNMKFVLDSGNFFCVGEDVLSAYDCLSDRTVRVHVKDWRMNPQGAMMREQIGRFEGCAIGEGILPNGKLIRTLRENKFGGSLVLEVNACEVSLDLLDRSCDYLLHEMNI